MLDAREIKKVLVVFLSIAVVLGAFVGIRSLNSNNKTSEPDIEVNENEEKEDEELEDIEVEENTSSKVEQIVSSNKEESVVQNVSKEKPVIDLEDNYVVQLSDKFELPTMDKDSNGNKVTTVITYEFLPFDSLEYYSVTGIDTNKLGTYKVTYKVTNKYGTTSKVVYIDVVDNEAPVVSANLKTYETVEGERVETDVPVSENSFVNDTVYFSFSDNDEIAYAEYYKALKEIINGEETIEKDAMQNVIDIDLENDFFLFEEGEYHIRVTDRSGNTSEFVVTIDKTNPIVEKQVINQNGDEVEVSVSFDEKVQEVEGWTLSEDGKTLTKVYTENKQERIMVKDLAGNEIPVFALADRTISFYQNDVLIKNGKTVNDAVDDIMLVIDNPNDGTLIMENPSGEAEYFITAGAGGTNNFSSAFVSAFGYGDYTLTFTDILGNVATFTLTIVDLPVTN